MRKKYIFKQDHLQAISDILGDTNYGLTGSEIGNILNQMGLADPTPSLTKRHRLFNALAESQNKYQDGKYIIAFIHKVMKPTLYIKNKDLFDSRKEKLNIALSFCGLELKQDGKLHKVSEVGTLEEAYKRASKLQTELLKRNVHQDVLKFCKAELLEENYFHAVFEAIKSKYTAISLVMSLIAILLSILFFILSYRQNGKSDAEPNSNSDSFTTLVSSAHKVPGSTLQPWSLETTKLFDTDVQAGGWFGDSLVLNYLDNYSARSSTISEPVNFIPQNAVGISFDVSSTTDIARIHVGATGFGATGFPSQLEVIGQHSIITLEDNMDFSANIRGFLPGVNRGYDIPESTKNGVTTVEWFFIQELIDSPNLQMWFNADGRGSAASTTFSNVSWIMRPEPGAITEPYTIILFIVGTLGLFAIFRSRKKKSK